MNEFDIIEKYFLPLTRGQAGVAGLKDDGAVIDIPEGFDLVVSSDTLNADTHFLKNEAPENIARKALRTNLSDIASMGAKPLCYQLNLAFPEKPTESWLAAFSNALQDDNALYGIYCSGGDTTGISGGYLSVSVTIMGLVPRGKAVRRSGAKAGDLLIVSGDIGDAALGLKAIRAGKEALYPDAVARYRVPEPRVAMHGFLQAYVNAAADVSDGLLADAQNIAKASGVGVEIDPARVPISKDVRKALEDKFITWGDILSTGDDYELIMALSNNIEYEGSFFDFKQTVIGRFLDLDLGFSIKDTYTDRIDINTLGWKHF